MIPVFVFCYHLLRSLSFLLNRKDLVSLYIFLCREPPLSRSTLSIYYKYRPFSASLSSITFSLLSVLSYRAGFNCEKGKENKGERETERVFFLFLFLLVLFCFYLFLSWVCDIDTIMSTYRDEDPRIHGIKTKIRVVPNFPKQGSSCDFLSFSLFAR